jgi:predicted RNase H-like HicB family nuclease
MSTQKFTIFVKPGEADGFTAQCVELPIYCHGKTKEEALEKLKTAIESTGWKLTQQPQTSKTCL